MWSRAWPHLRVLFIGFHVAAILLTCTPHPGQVLDRARWRSPSGQAKFRAWSERLGAIGIETTAKGLERWLWARGEDYRAARRAVSKPFAPYVERLRLVQGWALFTNPQRRPARVVVELHTPAEGWRTLTVLRSEVFDWKAAELDNHRLRKLTGRIARRTSKHIYNRLVLWLAREAAREFPRADRLRVQLFRYRTGPPGAARRLVDGRFTDARVLDLEARR
jgi:hypothetical protein